MDEKAEIREAIRSLEMRAARMEGALRLIYEEVSGTTTPLSFVPEPEQVLAAVRLSLMAGDELEESYVS